MGIARDEWEHAGYQVVGAALSGIAAGNLESGSGIASRTIASLEYQWSSQREWLDERSIRVIDEAGMIGTRQMERVISEAEKRGAKVVLVGDPEQLQAIEAGAAFRALAERHGSVEITQVRRQREDWQRDATRHLAIGDAGPAPARDPFAGLDLRPIATPPTRGIATALDAPRSQPAHIVQPAGLNQAMQRFARAAADIIRMRRDGYAELPHQRIAFDKARDALEAVRPDAARDLRAAFARNAGLIEDAAKGRTSAAIRAMALEAELRMSPERRADRFVEDWQKLARAHRSLRNAGDEAGARRVGQQMSALGKSLERDAQAESLVRKRLPELGIRAREGASISHSIQDWLGLSRGRGLGR